MVMMMMITAVFVPVVISFQQPQHLQHSGLQGSAQLPAAVRSAERRHMDEGGAALPQVQRGVVGVVAQVPARKPDSQTATLVSRTGMGKLWPVELFNLVRQT